jgi:hypothetical protein
LVENGYGPTGSVDIRVETVASGLEVPWGLALAPDSRSATRDRIILDNLPAARFHNGGRLWFGPDGRLYVGTGDARKPDLSQNRESLAGKILRLTAEGDVPADNPFSGNPVYLLGIRNCPIAIGRGRNAFFSGT